MRAMTSGDVSNFTDLLFNLTFVFFFNFSIEPVYSILPKLRERKPYFGMRREKGLLPYTLTITWQGGESEFSQFEIASDEA